MQLYIGDLPAAGPTAHKAVPLDSDRFVLVWQQEHPECYQDSLNEYETTHIHVVACVNAITFFRLMRDDVPPLLIRQHLCISCPEND